MIERLVRIGDPYDLRGTLATLSRTSTVPPIARWIDDTFYKASSSPEGPVTLGFSRVAEGVVVRAWGPGADWGLSVAERWTGALDASTDFPAHLHPRLPELHKRFAGVRLAHTHRVFDALFGVILEQKVTGKGAFQSRQSLVHAYGEPAPGPADLLLPPDPRVIRTLGYASFHLHNVERKRATILVEVAQRANRMEEATAMALPDAHARLQAMRGIGPWTAGVVARVALGDPDAVAVGDYHLPNLVAWLLAGEPRADDTRMLELLEPFRGHRARVIAYLGRTGESAPRYGARLGVNDIRGR